MSEYLEQGGYDRHLRQLRAALAQHRDTTLRDIAKHFPPGTRATRATRPEGGYFIWVELPPKIDALELHRLALSQGISLSPGHLFSPDHRFRNHVRINFGHPDHKDFHAALKTAGTIARALAD